MTSIQSYKKCLHVCARVPILNTFATRQVMVCNWDHALVKKTVVTFDKTRFVMRIVTKFLSTEHSQIQKVLDIQVIISL